MKKLLMIIAVLIPSLMLLTANDYSFEVDKKGDGEAHIILIPGFTCSADVWTATVNELKNQFTCHSLTMPGFAGQEPSKQASLENWITEIAQYIETETPGKAHIIGHSIGGMMAQWLAADYPKLIESIVVVDALPSLATLYNPNFNLKEGTDCSYYKTMFELNDADFEQNQRRGLSMQTTEESKHDILIEWALLSDRNTLSEIFCQIMNLDLREKVAKIECKSTILLEANFEMMGETITGQYTNLKGADLQFATKGMHFIMFDDWDWYSDQIARHFN